MELTTRPRLEQSSPSRSTPTPIVGIEVRVPPHLSRELGGRDETEVCSAAHEMRSECARGVAYCGDIGVVQAVCGDFE